MTSATTRVAQDVYIAPDADLFGRFHRAIG